MARARRLAGGAVARRARPGVSGSLEALIDAFRAGCSVKVGVRNLCRELADPGQPFTEHETFVELGSMYYHRERGFHSGESVPLVRIGPAVPLI